MVNLSDLTFVGWLLVLATIAVIAVVCLALGGFWFNALPAGRYPAVLLGLPALIAGIVFFVISKMVLTRVGLRVVRVRPGDQVGTSQLPRDEG